MTVHLVKMAVGVESFDHLAQIQSERIAQAGLQGGGGQLRHMTRNRPRREGDVLENGSIFWIIKGYIRARQNITGFGDGMGRNGRARCAIILDPQLVRTVLTPHKPIQGWRYMDALAAPADLGAREMEVETALPDNMADELRILGLL
jgi:hypothetical protein